MYANCKPILMERWL